jgi:cell wall-associated NlpC family hydrolase
MSPRKRIVRFISWIVLFIFMFSFKPFPGVSKKIIDPIFTPTGNNDTIQSRKSILPDASLKTGTTSPEEFTRFAKSLLGSPYKYASQNPVSGFDCSGFINYVANHFRIKVPRSSVQFTNIGKEVKEEEATAGDLILFTGTNPASGIVGHIGIVTENINRKLNFIHSSSGKGKGVVIDELSNYYRSRFVKVIRIFP